MKVIRTFNAQPVKIPHFKGLLTRKQARWPHFFYCIFIMFISWMFITASFKKSLIVEQFQANYLNSKWMLWKPATPFWGFNLNRWYHWRQQFLLYDKTRFDFQTSTSSKFLFLSVCIQLKFWQLTLVFSTFYRLYLEITCFCNKPSGQIFLCHVTDVKYYNSFRSLHEYSIGLWLSRVSGISL